MAKITTRGTLPNGAGYVRAVMRRYVGEGHLGLPGRESGNRRGRQDEHRGPGFRVAGGGVGVDRVSESGFTSLIGDEFQKSFARLDKSWAGAMVRSVAPGEIG